MIFVKNSMGAGGQHDQHCVKNKFVKNRVGGSGVNLNMDNVFKYTGFFLDVTPYTTSFIFDTLPFLNFFKNQVPWKLPLSEVF